MGFIFLWTFLDKTFGLGYATTPDKAWIAGNSPTAGFLQFGTEGPLATLFGSLSGNLAVDLLFMMGMLLIGISLILGMGVKIAGWTGSLMMFMIYLSVFPPENNPVVDEHIIYILVLLFFTTKPEVGDVFGFGRVWKKSALVKRCPLLA